MILDLCLALGLTLAVSLQRVSEATRPGMSVEDMDAERARRLQELTALQRLVTGQVKQVRDLASLPCTPAAGPTQELRAPAAAGIHASIVASCMPHLMSYAVRHHTTCSRRGVRNELLQVATCVGTHAVGRQFY